MGKYIKAQTVIIIVAVCAIVAVTHWPTLSAKALSIDDRQYFAKNTLVQNPGWASAKRFLTEVLKPSTVEGYYQPLAMISLMLDSAAGGSENNLLPFHITSLSLHIVNTALIIVLLYLLFGNIWAAAAAGLLFGVHPMTVEPIPWVGERKTLLAAFFAFWSLIFYVRYCRSGGWKSYAGCFVMYLLALMSKPTSVPLPVAMLMIDYWPLKRLSARNVLEKVPLFALGAVFAVITYISQSQTAGTMSPMKLGLANVPLVLCHNIFFYLYKIVWPVSLSWHYAFPKNLTLSNPMILAGVIGTCVLIPLLLASLRRTRAAMTGWLIFFVMILPTMGVVRFTDVIASDRFAYLPSVGLLIILTSFLIWVWRDSRAKTITAAVVFMLASSEAFSTQHYLAYWQDSMTLVSHMLSLSPDSARLYNSRGTEYCAKGAYDLAMSDFNKAVELSPKYAGAYNNRGIAYVQWKGEFDLAISDYNKAIEANPRYAEAYSNRGTAYKSKGRLDLAISDYNKALEINTSLVEVYINRGSVYKSKGRLDLAISDYNKGLEINPRCVEAYNNLGNVYAGKGEYDLAVADYNKAIEINPRSAEAYCNRGTAYYDKGAYNIAVLDFDKAIEIKPKYPDALFNKASACENAGRLKEAVEAYKVFIQYAPVQYKPFIEQAKQKIKELER